MRDMFRSMFFRVILWMALPVVMFASPAAAQPLQILVFGDSLSSGFDLEEAQGFPAVLKHRLLADGYDVGVWNGSNPRDTSGDGLARIDLALEHHPDLVILEFGARFVRVRGAIKVKCHLTFGVLVLAADQILRVSAFRAAPA